MSGAYNPVKDSVAWHAIEFFTTNPDDELTTDALSVKFGKAATQFHSLLATAIECGALTRRTNDDGDLAYRLGKGLSQIKANPAAHPTLNAPLTTSGPSTKARRPIVQIDFSALKVRKDVPLPPARTTNSRWPALLEGMDVGDSYVLPRANKGGVGAAVSKFNTAKVREYALRILNDEEIGVWRVK